MTVNGVTLADGNGGGNYNLSYADNVTSAIARANLTIGATDVTKTYDGTLAASSSAFVRSGTVYNNVENGGVADTIVGGNFAFANANAGVNKTVTISGVTVSDGNGGGNYNVTYANSTGSVIGRAGLTLGVNDVTRTYDGTLNAAGTTVIRGGTLFTNASNGGAQDTIGGGSFAFTNANAGTNKTVTISGVTVADGNGGGNYDVTYADSTASVINRAALSIGTNAVTKTYDGSLNVADVAVLKAGTLYANASNGGATDSIGGGTFAFANANVGTGKTVNASGVTVGDGNNGNNYTVTYVADTASAINRANLTIGAGNVSKTYDGGLNATGTAIVIGGTLFSNASNGYVPDTISGGSFAFTNANAGTGKTVTIGGVTLQDGNGGGNYNVTYANNTASTIGRAALTVGTTAVTKTYDGTLAANGVATVTAGSLFHNASNGGALDTIGGGSFAFTNTNAGNGKTVTVGGVTVTDGNSGGNYNVTYANNTASTIDRANLTLGSVDIAKTYDGTLTAGGTAVVKAGTLFANAGNGGLTDRIDGGTFAFTDANAGVNKTVTTGGVTLTDGNGGGNYNVTYANNTASTINRAALVIGTSNVTKTYDGSLTGPGTAVVNTGTLYHNASNGGAVDTIGGGEFTFDTANAGTGKTVAVSGVSVNDGNGGGNYDVTYASNTASTINRANLTLGAGTVNKTYDGTLAASGTSLISGGMLYANASHGNLQDVISGGSFAFDNANAGTGKTVTISGVTINDGNGGGNYNLTYANSTSGSISRAALTIGSSNVTKTYDGTLAASGTAIVTGGTLFANASNGGATDSIGGGGFAFANANAGTAKTVTVGGVTVNDGNGGNNYTVTYADNTSSVINRAAITVGSTDVSKTYDGSLTATGTATLLSGALYHNASNGGVADTLSGGSFAFANANAGTNKTVTVGGVGVTDGNGGGNYNVTFADNTNSAIGRAALTVSTGAIVKTYDGSRTGAGTAIVTGGTLFSNASNGGALDHLSGGTYQFADANAGGGKTVQVGNVIIGDGNGGGNYNVTYADNTASTINRANLTLGLADVAKTYDGTLAAAGTAIVTGGTLFGSDSIGGGAFAFTDANAGVNKTVTIGGVTLNDGNGGGNYTVAYANNTSSTIGKAGLTIGTTDVTKIYDGALSANGNAVVTGGTLFANASNGNARDSIDGGTFAFTDANAGANKTVTVHGVALYDGNNGGNYTVTYADNTASAIGKAALTLSAGSVVKSYDGTLAASGAPVITSGALHNNASHGGLADALSGGNFLFDTANAGGGKTVTISGVTLNDGNGGGNYTVTYAPSMTGTITRAAITVGSVDVTKVYDGTTTAVGSPSILSGALFTNASNGNMRDSLNGGAFAFTDPAIGTGKTVTVSGITIDDGNGGGNYALTLADNSSSTILSGTPPVMTAIPPSVIQQQVAQVVNATAHTISPAPGYEFLPVTTNFTRSFTAPINIAGIDPVLTINSDLNMSLNGQKIFRAGEIDDGTYKN